LIKQQAFGWYSMKTRIYSWRTFSRIAEELIIQSLRMFFEVKFRRFKGLHSETAFGKKLANFR